MKKLVLFIAGISVAQLGFSQIKIDPEIGANFSSTKTKIGEGDSEYSDVKTGISAGVGVNIDLGKGLYLKPGVQYQLLGGVNEIASVETKTDLHYLRVPVNLGYNYQLAPNAGSLFVEAGPYVGYAMSGKTTVTSALGEVENDLTFGDGAAEVNPFDWGFNFGLGYETPWGIYVKGSYGLGLGNMSNVEDYSNTNGHWNVGVGYRISLK